MTMTKTQVIAEVMHTLSYDDYVDLEVDDCPVTVESEYVSRLHRIFHVFIMCDKVGTFSNKTALKQGLRKLGKNFILM